MQYKIPVQVENEDKIVLWLSLRQLVILMVWGWIAYSIFTSLEPQFGWEIALIPSMIIMGIFAWVALLKIHHMSFTPFILALARLNINARERSWIMGVDSFTPMTIGYVTTWQENVKENIKVTSLEEKKKDMDEFLKNL